MMKYRPDGHRDKESAWNFDWIHSSLERGTPQRDDHGQIMRDEHGDVIYDTDAYRFLYDNEKQEARITFFGMHLTQAAMYRHATIKLVESEKTAILMAIAYGNSASDLWMACGGLEMLTRERLKPLIDQGRRVWLWPDKDGIDKWQEVADKLGSEQVQVYTKFFDTCWEPQDGDKADAADITIRIMHDPTFKPRKAVEKTEVQQQPTEQQTDEEQEREAIRRDVALHGDEPFLDPEEMTDPELHRRREILGKSSDSGTTSTNHATVRHLRQPPLKA